MKRKASAVWQGDLRQGNGTMSTESGVLQNAQYSFGTRFEQGTGTNPEELLGAAHAGCFSMALSLILGESEITPEQIETHADVSLEPDDGGFSISAIHLETRIRVPGGDRETIEDAAQKAKQGCPVAQLFNAEITLGTQVET